MKKFILIFVVSMTIATVATLSNASPKGFKTIAEAVQKLSKYQPTDLQGERERFRTGKPMNIDKMYADLDLAAKLVRTTPITEELAYQMERVALITVINNPAADGVSLILPAYIKYPKVFEEAATGLDENDEALILETLRGMHKSLQGQD